MPSPHDLRRQDYRRAVRRRWPHLVAALLVPHGMVSTLGAVQRADSLFVAPIGGTWEPVQSLGQPPRFKPRLSIGFGFDRLEPEYEGGVTGALGWYYDLTNPVFGLFGVSAEGYLGQRGRHLDPGARVFLDSRLFYLRGGVDWNARLYRSDFVLSLAFPTTRGGWFGRGGEFRVDWIPGRNHSVVLGVSAPLAQPLAGKTRPKRVSVPMPRPPRVDHLPPPPHGTPLGDAVAELDRSALWVVRLHNLFWLTSESGLLYDETIDRSRDALVAFRAELRARDSLLPDRNTYAREVEFYHRLLDLSFGLAIGVPADSGLARGRAIADVARRITLEEVFLPYNRAVGQYKQPDVLGGLVARARARFIAWLELDETLDAPQSREALRVLDAWQDGLEDLRRLLHSLTNDSRMQWLPLALVLRPGQHDTQKKIDQIIALALGTGFTEGNAALYLNAPQFQVELTRSIHDTETYHVLWIHDYRGRDELGLPDHTGFAQTARGYLRALVDDVRNYDRTGRLPIYLILLDQHYYEVNDARLWLSLLERPLTRTMRLPSPFQWMSDSIAVLQDSLRSAVAGSRRLQAEAEAFGQGWIGQVVKVHVNITNPADFSFRSRHLLGLPIGPDNVMRDHRKIVIRDVSEANPAAGEVILAGVGVGDIYASRAWDDRAILIQGPAALAAKAAARDVLVAHGLEDDRLPAPLRPEPFALDYGARLAAVEAVGATARVLQAHNRTGWGQKDATFVQMLLYDLVPPGTVLYIPDSLWTSFEWMAQLVAAAFRGCRVYVVAPALSHAPSAGYPQMSVTQELIARLVVVVQEMGDVIREDGGELRVGLYTRQAPIGALRADLAEVIETYARSPFLHRLFPLPAAGWDLVRRFRDGAPMRGDTAQLPPAASVDSTPKLHRKTQFIASGDVLTAMARHPAMAGALETLLRDFAEGAVRPTESGPIPTQQRMRAPLQLLRVFDELPQGVRDSAVLYLATGSLNKNVRSMALDGEAIALVGGRWALQSYVDFLLLSGVTTWVDDPDELDRLHPPFSWIKRWIGRRLRRIL